MNYSTFDLYNFYIKKDSTLPYLKFPLTQKLRESYGITDDMLRNVAVTFSMINAETGLYCIANVGADLIVNDDLESNHAEEKYTLTYGFKLSQTSKIGRYLGEFKIDFLGSGGKLTIPTQSQINIIISDSITKTSVV